MKFCLNVFLALFLACFGAVAAVAPDTVVATVNGKKMTAGELESILAGIPPDTQEQLRGDKRQFVEQYALLNLLSEQAIEEGIHEQSPYKEQLEWNRGQVLVQAAIAEQARALRESGAVGQSLDSAMKTWLDEVRNGASATYENQDYFADDVEKAAAVPDDQVVATVNGRSITAGAMKRMLQGGAPRIRENFQKDRRQFFQEYAMMEKLIEIAEEKKLQEKSPYREQLVWVRKNILSQARLNEYTDSINIGRAEEQEFYEANQDRYSIVKVKVLYVAFGSGDAVGSEVNGKKILSEAEAKAKVEDLRRRIETGADFVELVKQHSDDETSRAADGDFGAIHRNERIPRHILDAVFSLEEGEVSPPVRQPNGFYLFRAEEVRTKSLDEVRQELNRQAKNEKFNEWFETVRASIDVTFENEEYFGSARE